MKINDTNITFEEFAELYAAYKKFTKPEQIKNPTPTPEPKPEPAPEPKPEPAPGADPAQVEILEKLTTTLEGINERLTAIENQPPTPIIKDIEPKGLDDIVTKILGK